MSRSTRFELKHYTSRDVEQLREDIRREFAAPSDEYLRDRIIRELNQQWDAELVRRGREARREESVPALFAAS